MHRHNDDHGKRGQDEDCGATADHLMIQSAASGKGAQSVKSRKAGLLRLVCGALAAVALMIVAGLAYGQDRERLEAVGLRRIAFVDGDRTLALSLFYPARGDSAAQPFVFPFSINVRVLADAPPLEGTRRPLILFSHGRGSNGLLYAWFAEHLATRGFIVAAIDHYRANSYDSTIAYLANRLWQRPVDLSLAISFLLGDPDWSRLIDGERIGVAGHSQGGFTTLWIGGAEVSAQGYHAFQEGWRNNRLVPEHLRRDLPVDPAPALRVRDPRVKAAFAMAPGIIKAFGMDEAGLARMTIPAYITVGAADTQTPPGPNAAFAAAHIPRARLVILPGAVDHEIFVNECNQDGRNEFPEACIDAPGVDRGALHAAIGDAAVKFFRESLAVTPRP
jgi:predicted dienelactone hydrolase